ncbi:MAG TPA: hypothetical protein VFG14_00150 [Chthoniobacteraceae bacterium]|jgi:hypothetical protein|nr:hypothetical protein [Chthoniobacteraceae bacterium]
MKRALVLALLTPMVFCGCGDTVRAYLGTGTPVPATPVPAPTPVAKGKASPTPGNWMWKDYQNPLDSHKQPKKKKPN